jgi:UDPglucose 6-dehydrogenase
MEPLRIAVVGLWHLGETYSAGLAELGHTVIGIDEDENVTDALRNGVPPLPEPGLEELLKKHLAAGSLSYTSDFSHAATCDVVWLTYDTPVDDEDEADITPILTSFERLIPHLKDNVILLVSSQIPVGTSAVLVEHLREARPDLSFVYAYSPENLRLGDALNCFLTPERVIVGTDPVSAKRIEAVLAPLSTRIVTMDPASAEMVKHALNAYLATSISFANDIADVCEHHGADAETVMRALKSDARIGERAYLFAGLGFSGGTLGRDLKALLARGKAHHLHLPIIEGVYQKNKSRSAIVPLRLAKKLGELRGKRLALFGVTYKAGTSTLRRSQPLEIEKMLRNEGAIISLYDPLARPDEIAAITPSSFSSDPYVAAKDADCILIMTPSKGFRELDFASLRSAMKGNLLFDTCTILTEKREELEALGFTYLCVGR